MNLITLPFAGGSQYSFSRFNNYSGTMGIRMITTEYPGRGKRFGDPFLMNMDELVEDLLKQVGPVLIPPYAIYGHSMGTIAGYLLTKKIIGLNLPRPVHLFFSGNPGLASKERDPPMHLLPRKEFLVRLRELGGCPDEILQQNNIVEIFEPIIRADFKMVETYIHQGGQPIDTPITVLLGRDDKATSGYPVTWQNETTGVVEVIEFDGDHFFIFKNEARIMNIIGKRVLHRAYQ
jgi:external thioesterase TEII